MNIAIPVAISRMYEGRRILSLNNLKSTNGGTAFLSITTNTVNDIADIVNAPAICDMFSALAPICTSVSATRNEVIVAERASIPLMSIENGSLFFSDTPPRAFESLDRFGNLCSLTNLAISNVTNAEKGTMAKKVACQPKVWMMLAPTNRPTTEPAEYAEPNTPTARESLAGGNVSLRRLNAAGT